MGETPIGELLRMWVERTAEPEQPIVTPLTEEQRKAIDSFKKGSK